MMTLTSRLATSRRALAARALAVGLVAAISTAGAAAPSSAAEAPTPEPALTWAISEQFVQHLSTRTFEDGARESNGAFVFGKGSSAYDAASGRFVASYRGAVRGAFAMGPTEYYGVRVADPVVSFDASGSGQVTALVSAKNAAAQGNAAAETTPKRVVVTRFNKAATANGVLRSLTAVPSWTGVLPAGSTQAQELGLAAGKPVDGKSFAPEFMAQLTAGVRAHFHATGADSDAKKAPAPLNATLAPATTAQVVAADASGIRLSVTGHQFNVADANDLGLYIGLAPAGGLPDVSDPAGIGAFPAVDWIGGAYICNGSFTASVPVPADRLDKTKTYSLYTWRAHSRSSGDRDSATEVAIDFSKLTGSGSAGIAPGGAKDCRPGDGGSGDGGSGDGKPPSVDNPVTFAPGKKPGTQQAPQTQQPIQQSPVSNPQGLNAPIDPVAGLPVDAVAGAPVAGTTMTSSSAPLRLAAALPAASTGATFTAGWWIGGALMAGAIALVGSTLLLPRRL